MSTPISSNPTGQRPIRKQGMDIYTVMLLLSVIFMLVAVIAMVVEFRRYAPDYWKTSSAQFQSGMVVTPPF